MCNIHLDTRGDIEEHSAHTHGININRISREASNKVNDTAVLTLAKSTNICELPTEKRHQLMNSWFNLCAATGTVTDVEGQENATIQRHKSANFLEVLKGAIGTDFYNKVNYQLATIIKESSDLLLGFSCKWSSFELAVENSLGAMAAVKRLVHFVSLKEYMKGGITLAATF